MANDPALEAPEGYNVPDTVEELLEELPETEEVEEVEEVEEGPLFEPKSISSRTMMWGAIGKLFDEAPATAADAIEQAGLGWRVELRSLGYHNSKGNFVRAPRQFATVRTDTDEMLGAVKSRYTPIQNREAFDLANTLVDDYSANIESAFETHGGKVVGMTMRLPDDVLIGGEEAFGSYLMMRTTHDGSGALKLAINQVRMACLNEFDFRIKGAPNRFSIHHTGNASSSIAEAREALEITFKYQESFQEEVERMMNATISEDKAKSALDNILQSRRFGDRSREKIVNATAQNLRFSTTIPDDQRNTVFGWMNASTEYWQHIRSFRTDQSRYLVNSEGPGFHLRNDMAKAYMALA